MTVAPPLRSVAPDDPCEIEPDGYGKRPFRRGRFSFQRGVFARFAHLRSAEWALLASEAPRMGAREDSFSLVHTAIKEQISFFEKIHPVVLSVCPAGTSLEALGAALL